MYVLVTGFVLVLRTIKRHMTMKKISFWLLSFALLGSIGFAQAQRVLEYKKYYHKGQNNIKVGKYEEAIADLDKAIDRMPYYSAMYAERGKAKLKTKDYTGAINDFTITLQKKPYDYQSYLQRGLAYYYLQDYTNAELDFQDALHYKPYDQDAQKYLAQTHAKQQEIQRKLIQKQNEVLAAQNFETERTRWEQRQRRRYRNQLIWGTIIPLAIWTGILIWR